MTIAVVAQRAGVGTGTVSRVINAAAGVAPATRQRVLDVIAELGYQPSQAARSLSRGRTSTIAVVAPFFTHPSAVERLRGLVRALTAARYEVVLHGVEMSDHRAPVLEGLAAPGRADGVVIVSLPPTDEEVARFATTGMPVVLLDAFHTGMPSIVIDNIVGGETAARHLWDLGHRRIGFVGDLPENAYGFTSSVDRREGFTRFLSERGVTVDPAYVLEGVHDRDVAARLTDHLFDTHPAPPTAFFAASDTQALGVLAALRARGLRVPEDISVIGFDDIEVAAYVGLTTVRQPLEASGVTAASLLVDAIDDNRIPDASLITLDTALVARQTTSPPVPAAPGTP